MFRSSASLIKVPKCPELYAVRKYPHLPYIMDEEKDEVNKGESKGDELQVADDFKGKWISFRNKGKKKIKKLLKSRKHTKTVEGDSEEDDDEEYDDDDRLDSTFLDAGASTEDEHYSSGKESPKSTPGHGVTAKEVCHNEMSVF